MCMCVIVLVLLHEQGVGCWCVLTRECVCVVSALVGDGERLSPGYDLVITASVNLLSAGYSAQKENNNRIISLKNY